MEKNIEEANDLMNEKRKQYGGDLPQSEQQSGGYQSNKPEGFDDKDLQVLSIQNNEQVMKKRRFNCYKTNCKSGKRPY